MARTFNIVRVRRRLDPPHTSFPRQLHRLARETAQALSTRRKGPFRSTDPGGRLTNLFSSLAIPIIRRLAARGFAAFSPRLRPRPSASGVGKRPSGETFV